MRPTVLASKTGSGPFAAAPGGRSGGEQGIAVVISLIALSVLGLLGMFMVMNASTETRISDNYESRVQASFAAQAGMNHAREALRGLPIGVHLAGPDGTHSTSGTYLAAAQTYDFRNPLSWALARSLNIANPAPDLAAVPDDGIITPGKLGTVTGTSLIPLTGVVWSQANLNGTGTSIIGRYFVKITNNVLEDPDPFVDTDNIVIARSMGVAATIREEAGGVVRRNSVVVYEARFRQRTTFNLDSPFVIEGSQIDPSGPKMWDGAAFSIDGGAHNYGISTIDTDSGDGIAPTDQITSRMENNNQEKNITGSGSTPSITDITAAISADPDKVLLRDPNYLWNLVNVVLPRYADNYVDGDTKWSGGDAPDLGFIDPKKEYNDPVQRPKITVVHGDLDIGGNIEGGGVLVVTGTLNGNGHLEFNGLVLVIGEGNVDGSGLNVGIEGGMFVANLVPSATGSGYDFGVPKFSWRGNSNIVMNSKTIKMGMEQMPPEQLGWREITGVIDP